MSQKHVHTPTSTRPSCPVCREPVYSRAGIHPQCALKQSDPLSQKNKPKAGAIPVVVEGLPLDLIVPVATEVLIPTEE